MNNPIVAFATMILVVAVFLAFTGKSIIWIVAALVTIWAVARTHKSITGRRP